MSTNTSYINIEPQGDALHAHNQIIELADQLASRSQWTLFLAMFVLWLLVSAFAVRYMVMKRDESNEALLSSEQRRVDIIRELSTEKERMAQDYARRLEEIVRQQAENNQRMIGALEGIQRAMERKAEHA